MAHEEVEFAVWIGACYVYLGSVNVCAVTVFTVIVAVGAANIDFASWIDLMLK